MREARFRPARKRDDGTNGINGTYERAPWLFPFVQFFPFVPSSLFNSVLRDPRLEVQPQAELPFPHRGQGLEGGNPPSGGRVHRTVRLPQVHLIESVEEFGSGLALELFGNPEVLAQRRVVVKEPRPEERVARHGPESPRLRP